jgi:glutamyl-tRNA(Gln) amidotransferase subunit E
MGFSARFVGTLLGHNLKCIEGHIPMHKDFSYRRVVDMFAFLSKQKLHQSLSKLMLPVIYQHPNMDFNSVLTSINFKKRNVDELTAPVDYLIEKFKEIRVTKDNNPKIVVNWVMGQLNRQALGNADLKELRKRIEERVNS